MVAGAYFTPGAASAHEDLCRQIWQLASAFSTYLSRCGHWHDWIAVQQRAVEVTGRHSNHLGEAHAQAALELYEAAGNLVGQAQSPNAMGWFHAELGNYAEAITHCERAVELYRKLGDRQGAAQVVDSLGKARHRMGHHQGAAFAYKEALRELRAQGDHYHEAIPLEHPDAVKVRALLSWLDSDG